jgi:tRNA(fMet)-specific endonuclease VapC
MKLAIDTNIYAAASARDPDVGGVLATASQILVPFVVLAELRYGFLYGRRYAENERQIQVFLNTPRVELLFADERTTLEYARLAAQLRSQGTPLPTNDLWIAALVIQHGLVLYSNDKHFDQLPQVQRV